MSSKQRTHRCKIPSVPGLMLKVEKLNMQADIFSDEPDCWHPGI
jgi:hypothetical protein